MAAADKFIRNCREAEYSSRGVVPTSVYVSACVSMCVCECMCVCVSV